MILKIKGVKHNRSLGTLINYIATDKDRIKDHKSVSLYHNVRGTSLEEIEQEFEHNFEEYAVKKQNSNKAVHIMLSYNPLDKNKVTIEMMDDIANMLIDKVYDKTLVWGCHHKSVDIQHHHTHLIVVANQLGSKKGTSLKKAELRKLHLDMLREIKEKYPKMTIGIDVDNYGKKYHSERAYYKQKRNPELTLSRDGLKEEVQGLFRSSQSTQDFHSKLAESGYQTYTHKGEVFGVYWNDGNMDRKMRFSRLGIDQEAEQALDQQQQRLAELKRLRETKPDQGQHHQYGPQIDRS